jgi:hypothetical protein
VGTRTLDLHRVEDTCKAKFLQVKLQVSNFRWGRICGRCQQRVKAIVGCHCWRQTNFHKGLRRTMVVSLAAAPDVIEARTIRKLRSQIIPFEQVEATR